MPKNVADFIVETLERAGVSRVWGIPGDSLNAFTDAIRRNGRIQWMHMRHEESGAFAAGAESAITGGLSVVAGSCGPGSLHFINGLYEANRARVPMLVVASQIPSAEIGSTYFQELHPQNLFRECSVYSELVSDPAQLPYIVEIATRTAIERRGVAVIVVPGDVFFKSAPERRPTAPIIATTPRIAPSDAELRTAAEIINAGHSVTILAGSGVANAHDEVVGLADRIKAPIVHAYGGKEHIEWDNPFDVGMTGLLGFTSGYRAMERADVLLMLGTDFPYRQFYPEKAKIIQVDIRGEQIGRRTAVDLALVGDVGDTVAALMPLLHTAESEEHLRGSVDHYRKTRKDLDELAVDDGQAPIHPEYVASLVDELAADDAVFTVDVGTPVVWGARFLRMTERRRLIGSFNHGSMANAMPQALGAQSTDRKRQVIALCGDGGIAMLMGDLLSIRQNDLPVKLVVFNNSALAFVETEMDAAGIVNFGTELINPNFADIATAAGIRGIRVEAGADLRQALTDAFADPGSVLVDVVVARRELAMPPTITEQEAKGFFLYSLRTIMSGRGKELLDMGETNVLRRLEHAAAGDR